jgi:hypothetical protein
LKPRELGVVRAHIRQVLGKVEVEPVALGRRQARQHGAEDIAQVVRLEPRLPGLGLQSREIEQVADGVVEAVEVLGDGSELVANARRIAAVALVDEAGDARGGGGQRRLELVRHGADQRRLEAVGLAQRFGVRGILLEALPLERRRREIGHGGQEARIISGHGDVLGGFDEEDVSGVDVAADERSCATVPGMASAAPTETTRRS